jgi:membrane protein YqaA with SNARE-associated domain
MFDIFSVVSQLFQSIDYWAIFIMMLIESSLLPFPSEFPLGMIGVLSAR